MRKLATVRTVSSIKAIEGADRIELAVVDGWKCVIKKGEFRPGDHVIYCEIDSFLPIRNEFEFLRKSSYRTMGEREGFRLRTVRLRGQISQGLLLSTGILNREAVIGEDVTAELGIVKYEPPIPACLNGNIVGPFPSFITKTDEERVQNLTDCYDTWKDRQFYVSEKLDGTSFTAFSHEDFGVCGRNWQIAEDERNSHWQIVRECQLKERLESIGRPLAVQGELIGPGIQKNRYNLKSLRLFVFNIFDISSYSYLPKQEMEDLCRELQLECVPFVEVRSVPDTIDEIMQLAEGASRLNASTEREGLVWVHGDGQERISFKTISNRFLTRHDD
ncbi:MAG: RNA ligase (ATP) [Planctomycetaceae bacterium]|nr:RNA ligase (ATP) [Planctomycetaceae bacterium]